MPRLFLKNKPVWSTVAITLQHRSSIENEDSWETIDSEDYFIDYEKSKITFVSGIFEKGIQNYRVTYTAGYYIPSEIEYQDGTDDDKDLPYDLELAVLDLVSTMYSERNSGGIAKEKVGQVEVTYVENAAQSPIIKTTLDKYARPEEYA
jgi:hypothetical protein